MRSSGELVSRMMELWDSYLETIDGLTIVGVEGKD